MPSVRITVKLPDLNKFSSEEFIKRIEDAMRTKTGPELKSLFQETVEGWEEKPTFAEYHTRTPSSISTRVSTIYGLFGGADIYALVSKGSPPHTIQPRRGGLLRFQSGYVAATHPGIIGSQRKHRFGDYVQAMSVNHPGFEGREFNKMIAELYAPDFRRDMQEAMKD